MAKKRMYLNGKIVEVDEDLYNARTYESMMAPVYSQNVNEQLAPTNKKKTEKEKEKQWYETIVEKPKAFDDGYQIGDVTGTVLGSTVDAGLNALEGIFRVGEGIATTGAGLLVEGIDAFAGENEYTKGVRRRIAGEDGAPPLTRLTQWLEDQIGDYSIFGKTGDEVFSGIGYTYGMLEGGKAIPGGGNVEVAVGSHVARLPVLSAVGGASSGFQEAYQKGATGTQALAKAFGSGAIESVTESMFGFMGIGGNDVTDEFAKKFVGNFNSGVAQNLAKIGISSTAEGFEEVMSSTANQFLDRMIDKYSGEKDPKFYEKLNPEELAQEFVTTFLSTAITGGYDSVTNINHLTNNAINNFEKEVGRPLTVAEKTSVRDQVARALANENTLNEQRVIDNEMNSRLAELGEYTRADRNRIRSEINQDLENGRISIDSIENTLPGISDQWNTQFNELRQLQEEIKSSEGAERDYLIGQYQQKLQEYNQDKRLRNSYVEEANKGIAFKYNDEGLTDMAKATYQSAVDSGMNNTKATHSLVELASKIADYTGVKIKFATNEQLKGLKEIADNLSGNDVIVNGAKVKSENTIYINSESNKNLITIIGHEVGHLLDEMDEGQKIRDFARKFADSKGEYNDRYTKLSKNYATNEISTEMANDIIGEYLFTDENFVTQLATEHPSTFKKIYNWFQHIFKMATSGSKEARQLEQVRYNLEKGLAKINENKVADTNVGESGKDINVGTKESVEKSDKIEYNKSAEREDFTDALSKEQWHRFYESVDKHGIEQKQEGAINTVIVDDKIIRSKYDGEKPNIFDVYKISEGFDELSKKFDITTSDILQDIYEIAEEENVDERKIKRSLEKYFKEGLLGRYDSNSNVFVDKNTNTRENIERNNSNIEKKSRGREDLSRTKQNRSIDDTSFSLSENEIQGLEDYSRDEIKQIATDYIKTAFLYSDVNATIKDMEIIGSRNRGTANENSDLDIVVELDGEDLREDDLFNVLNDDEEPLEINGIRVDFNPIVSYRSGTLEEFMERSNQYDQDILNKNDNSLTKQLEKNLENRLFNAERERQGMIDIFNSYLEENGIENPTQEDINNSLDAYDLMDANEDGTPISAIEKKYDQTIKEYLKEQGITLAEEIAPVRDDMISTKKDGTLQIRQKDIVATDQDLEKIFGKQINEDYDEAMEEAEKIKWSLDSKGRELSKEQQKFFKDSEIRDENGRLLAVYHGTMYGDFNEFKGKDAYFFTTSEKFADDYAHQKEFDFEYDMAEHRIMGLYLKATNLFDSQNEEKISQLRDALPDKVYFWGNEMDKDTYIERLQGKYDLPGKWTQEKLANAEFGSFLGDDRNGYCNDVFVGLDGNDITYIKQIDNDYIKNLTDEEKVRVQKELMENGKVDLEEIYTPWGYMTKNALEKLTQEYRNQGNEYGLKMLEENQSVYDWGTKTITAYKDRADVQHLTGQDNWNYIESSFTRDENGKTKDIIDYIRDLKFDAVKITEDGVENYMIFNANQIKNIDNKNPSDSNDIRFSLSTDNDGNELSEEQQTFFKNSKIRDNDGKLSVMYHGTPYGGFTVFNHNNNGSGGDSGYFGYGYYFTDNKQLADTYSDAQFISEDERTTVPGEYGNVETKQVYLNIVNPYMVDGTTVEYEDGALEKLLKTKDPYESTRKLKELGFDGVVYTGTDGIREVTAFEPNQIKNTDNTNPTENEDIRFSLSENEQKDNKGKKLSDNQLEFFKDSKIRDSKGRLLRVYHGTDNGDFTVFEENMVGSNLAPAFGDGFYFDSQRSTSEAYTGRDGVENIKTVYLNITNPYYASDSEAFTLKKQDLINKGYDGVSVYGHEFVAFYPEQIKNIDNVNPTTDSDIRFSLSEDSDGRKLSDEQKNYFKNTKAVDDKGNLVTVYHTTTDAGEQFNEFNPVGTDHYRFGDQIVNYYTDSQEMSGSYADQLYDKADTSRLNNVEEATKWIEDNRFNGLQQYDYELKDLKSVEGGKRLVLYDFNDGHVLNAFDYFSEEDFLKNVKTDVNKYNRPVENLHRKQYEGYVNITNPYILDANRRGWNQVTTKQTDELINAYRGLTKEQKAVVKDVMGWEDWGVFKDEVSKYYIAKYVDKQWNERYEKNGYEENLAEVGKMLHDQYTPNAKEGVIALKGYSDLHTIAGNNFTVKAIKKYAGIEQTTNDVVKSVLEQNKNGSNYDGVIIKNVVDYGGDTETRAPANVYVTFDSNQFKSTDNTSPTSDSDIRYSLSDEGELVDNKGKKVKLEASKVGKTNSLMAIHNLNESKLKGIIELGGFPVPSIAIVDTNKMTHSEFGDISVLFGKETIDPSKAKNEVYDRDVWSPTFPTVEYEVNRDTIKDIRKALEIDDYDYNANDSIQKKAVLDLYADNLENKLASQDLEGLKDYIKGNRDIQYSWLKQRGLIEPVYKTVKFNRDVSNEVLQSFLEQYQGMTDFSWNTPINELSYEQTMALKDNIKRIVKPYLEQEYSKYGKKGKDLIKSELASYDNYNKLADFLYSANSMNNNGIDTQELDEYETLQKADKIIDKDEFNKWVDETFNDSLIKNKGIRNNQDLFTPQGNARSFKATHDELNLANLVKALSRKPTKGGQDMSIFGTGFGRISAQESQRFRSINEIKQNQDRLMTREEAEKIIEPLSDKLYEDTQALAKYYKNTDYKSEIANNMQAMDMTGQLIEDFAGGSNTLEHFRKILQEWYGFDQNIPDSVLQNIIDDLDKAKNLPTDYFEAKPQRAVGLDEIQAVVLPNSASQDIKDQLSDLGINYYEYDKSNENAREEAINKFDDIKFSLDQDEDIAPVKLPKSYEPFYEFAQEKGFLDEDEKMMIFNGVDKDKKESVKDKVTTPREEYRKTPRITPEKSQMKKTIDLLDYMFVNRNSEIDNLARDSGNANIKYLGDMLNGVSGEAQNETMYGQTNNQGERIGKSVNELFEWANVSGKADAFNDYLLHYSNIDRHKNGKGSRVHQETSEKMVKKYERKFPEFKQHAKEVWNFSKNVRDNLLEAGLINQSTYDYLSEVYPHYVPYMEDKDITQFIDDSGKLKPVSAIKTAKGGATHSALTPVQEALTRYIYSEKKSIRQNDLYREIYNTLDGEKMLIGADDRSNPVETGTGLYRDENGSFLTAYFDGELNAIRISDDLYKQLDRRLERQIKDIEQNLSLITTPLQKISNIRRNLLTTWSPSFLLKNPIKDFGDALINSTDTKGFIKNYLPAYGELMSETDLAKQFKALYGSGNAMGEYESESGLSTGKKVAKSGKSLLQRIANFNEIVELAPRFAEFKATIERGGSVQEAMYNAREVTINFNRGGVVTKAMNRNGFTFLNASVQGFDKFIRNFSGQNGAIGVVGALLKATTFGVMPALFNHLIYAGGDDPDKDYEALPDYIKDNYYLIKTDDGTFIRIPKGRIPAVFGMVGRRTLEYAQGEEDAFEDMGSSIYDQIGFDPFNNHVFAPIQQAYFSGENGRAWYGGDLVPTRLQDKPAGEQYDESTDAISKWIGSKFGISPYKLNYVLDQYTGGMGDMFLPMITEEASSDAESLPEYMIAPIKDQFVVDSTMDNKYAGEFYQTKDEFTVKSNSMYATDEDILKEKYLYSVSSELGKLYKKKHEIQSNPTLSKKEKYEKVKAIQDEINRLAKEGLEGYNQLSKSDNYAIVGDREYYKDGDEWKKMSDKELDILNSLGLDLDEKASYIQSKGDISRIKEEYDETLEEATEEEKTVLNRQKKLDIIQAVKNSNLTDEAKAYLYTKNYGDYTTVNALNTLGISMNDYLDLESQEFTSDKYSNEKTVPNSKKRKVINYINSMSLTMEQKVILAKIKYPSMKTYNEQIIRYIQNNRYLDYDEKKLLLDKMGFKVENNRISW